MADLKPFCAIRPITEHVKNVAALPYDVMNRIEAKEFASENEFSFLHVDRSEIDLDDSINQYDDIVYLKAKDNLRKLINNGIFIKDKKPYIYLYKLIMNECEQTGIVCCNSIDDYINNIIKKHENTREEKEIDRIKHVDICDANTGPIFLTYRYNNEINDIIKIWTSKEPIYSFKSIDEVKHFVWIIDDDVIINKICNIFKSIDSIYIADGHHRAASAVKVGIKRREENPNYKGDEEFNYFLSVIFPHSELNLMDYNRVVKDLNGLSIDEYMLKVSDYFHICICEDNNPYKPLCKNTYGMYLDGKWYKLTLKKEVYNPDDSVDRLDVSILQDRLLKPILGINNPRTDSRIDFIGGIRGLTELQRRVEKQNQGVAFSLYPTTIEELLKIADEGKVMPPKSTWFEPKLRSGIFIHSLK